MRPFSKSPAPFPERAFEIRAGRVSYAGSDTGNSFFSDYGLGIFMAFFRLGRAEARCITSLGHEPAIGSGHAPKVRRDWISLVGNGKCSVTNVDQ